MEHDVIIIGAGVIGCAIARELSRYDWDTLILEKALEPGEGTTKANSAIVHAGYDPTPGTLKARLNVRGSRLIRELAPVLDFPCQQIGSLVIAFDEADDAVIRELYDRGLVNGVSGMRILNPAQIQAMEPNVSDQVTSALYCSEAAIVCPFLMTYAFLENAMANGVEFLRDHEVQAITWEGDTYRVTTTQGDFQARVVINAAGVHAAQIAAMLNETDYRITPRRGEYRLLDRSEGKMVSHIIFQTPTPLTKGVLVTPTVHGNLMVGPDSTQVRVIEEPVTTRDGLARIDQQAVKSVPDLRFDKTIRVFSGLRATPDTGDFLIYESEAHPGFFHAAGIESPGLASAPAIAELMRDLILASGRLRDHKKASITEARKGIPAFRSMTEGQREAALAEDPAWGQIVCRCETVSAAEVVQAIHRPAGARTMDGVKRWVRPGMGRCQGAFCGPQVMAILARELGIPEEAVLKDSRGSQLIIGTTKGEL